ncbi:TetR/AcrR family transcriptional regulator [Pediococcus stilesii]|nr:TetR/AcrR family transcriptional regulator [Pediococcus stilesii]
MEYTHKRKQTKDQLHMAMIQLIEKERFEKITVNQLVQTSGITRSTFYRYYEDKYELLEEIERYVINALVAASDLTKITPSSLDDSVEQMLNQYQEQFIILHALLSPNGDTAFENKLEKNVNKIFYDNNSVKSVEDEMMQLVMTAMWIRILKFWIFNENRIQIKVIKKLTLNLIQTIINK